MSVTRSIREFIEGLNLVTEVVSLSNDGVNTTLVLDRLFAIGDMRNVSIDGTDYVVLSVDYYNKSITVEGVLISALEVIQPSLLFKTGSKYQVNAEQSFGDEFDNYPMFYMEVPYRTARRNADEVRETIRANFVLCDVANYQDWNTEDYEEKTAQLSAFVDYIFSEIQSDYRFGNVDMTMKQVYYKYGELSSKNVPDNSVFNNRLTGVSMTMNIPIFKCCNK